MTDKRVIELLHQIVRGTHDSTPTRRIPSIDNKEAWRVDEWWQDYYTSNDTSLKLLAKEALNLIYGK
jgi:hypothetical protein